MKKSSRRRLHATHAPYLRHAQAFLNGVDVYAFFPDDFHLRDQALFSYLAGMTAMQAHLQLPHMTLALDKKICFHGWTGECLPVENDWSALAQLQLLGVECLQ